MRVYDENGHTIDVPRESLRDKAKYYWGLACKFEGLNPSNLCAVFSTANPYSRTYSLYIRLLRRAEKW